MTNHHHLGPGVISKAFSNVVLSKNISFPPASPLSALGEGLQKINFKRRQPFKLKVLTTSLNFLSMPAWEYPQRPTISLHHSPNQNTTAFHFSKKFISKTSTTQRCRRGVNSIYFTVHIGSKYSTRFQKSNAISAVN